VLKLFYIIGFIYESIQYLVECFIASLIDIWLVE